MIARRGHAGGRGDVSIPGYQLLVDGARCDGHGICALRCAERITLDEWGYATVDLEPIVALAMVARARRATAACPEGALQLVPCTGSVPGAFAAPGRSA